MAASAQTQSLCLLLQALTPCHIPGKRPVTFTPQVLTLSWHLCWGNVGGQHRGEKTGDDRMMRWAPTWPPLWWCFYCEKIWLFLCWIIMSAVQKSGALFFCSHTSPPCKQNIIGEKSKRESDKIPEKQDRVWQKRQDPKSVMEQEVEVESGGVHSLFILKKTF